MKGGVEGTPCGLLVLYLTGKLIGVVQKGSKEIYINKKKTVQSATATPIPCNYSHLPCYVCKPLFDINGMKKKT